MSNNIKILLVGVGVMGIEYAKVLHHQKQKFIAIGRGEEKANIFKKEFDTPVITGGVINAINELEKIPEYAIVAVNTYELASATVALIKAGVKRILVEKPAGFSCEEIENIIEVAEKEGAIVFVAYNRRFYASTEKAMEIISKDGGVTSFNFEFTEWSSSIEKLEKPRIEKENWMLANSTHVIDLAFFLGGEPKEISAYIGGASELKWHERCSLFSGAGISEKGALFSYQANWNAPGRWGVEILTRKHRLYFRPMEMLQVQNINSVQIESVEIDAAYEKEFKPGLYKQVNAFLNCPADRRLINIEQHLNHMKFYKRIAGLE